MKKVLVTGATGFIGRYIVAELLKRGYEVVASSVNAEKAATMPWISSVTYKGFDYAGFDDNENYHDFFGGPEAVMHLAWEGLPNYRALFHFEKNLPRHYDFLKNLVRNGCRDITIAGTCFEYGMRDGCLSEDMPADPQNAYAVAKDSLRKFLLELQKEQLFVLKWVRFFYMWGAGQNPKSLLSQLDRALEENEPVFNMSGGEQVRDYLPVETAASYFTDIAIQTRVQGVVNCCSGNPVKVKDLVQKYLAEKDRSIKLNLGYYPYPDYEPMSFWGDNSKLQSILNEQ